MKESWREQVVRFICNNCNRISEYDVVVSEYKVINSTKPVIKEYKVCRSCGRKFC